MKEIVDRFRRYFLHIGMMSFAIDMLMLTPVFYMLSVMHSAVPSRSNETLFVLTALALYAVAIMSLLDALRSRLLDRFGATLRTEVAPRLLTLNLQGLGQPENAKYALDDLQTIESFVTGQPIRAFFEMPWIPFMVWILYLFHPALAATAFLLLGLLVILTVVEDRLTAVHQQRAREARTRATYFAAIARQNVEAVSSLGMRDAIATRWGRLNADYLDHAERANRISARTKGLARFVRVAGQMAALAVGAWLLLNLENVTTGVMVASLLLMGRTLAPMDHVISAWKAFTDARRSYRRLEDLLTEAETSRLPALEMPRPLGSLSVERLQLWVGQTQRILAGINFRLAAGESLGIIGPSGSGKTSLARLIVGLIKPTQGHVRLDGAEVHQWAQGDLGQFIGYLPQDVVLFPGTIAENIARMQDPAEQTDAIIAAAKRARVHGMILALPRGYDTEVGEGGSRLSGGQRQMVGLARALFGNPSLVVMDEPNASLDSNSEAALADVIRTLKVSRVTVVIIAHKPSLMRDMDKLLVLRAGEQTMFGPMADIMGAMHRQQAIEGPVAATPGSQNTGNAA
jgi:ATP-binding cassette subfamily C exporter for protease/lipase